MNIWRYEKSTQKSVDEEKKEKNLTKRQEVRELNESEIKLGTM